MSNPLLGRTLYVHRSTATLVNTQIEANMYVLDLLKRSNSNAAHATEDVYFEYRLLCSGALYNAEVLTADWRKSDITRLLVDGPFILTVCSHPFDDYPQELSLRFQTALVTETKGRGPYVLCR
jgi:hypothetical protein